MPLSNEPFFATDALAEIMAELVAKYGSRWLARAAGVTQDMIRKVARGDSVLSFPTAARLSHALDEQKDDDSLVSLMKGRSGQLQDEPFVNGSLDDECLDMDQVVVEARRAFLQNDRAEAVRRLVATENVVRRMRAEIRRMA